MPSPHATPAMDPDRTDLVELTQAIVSAAASPTPSMAPGAAFGRYRIARALGSGGMGVVYLAEQTEPIRRFVAIKVMVLGRYSPELLLRFELERQALARMSHPGIAQILDAGTTPDGTPWFVMEHVEGEPLDQWLKTAAPSLDARIALLRDAARAVAHAHQKGVLHCDLKPSNLLVTEVDGRAFLKLIDFGIARALGAGAGQVSAGTPGYMSPEQSRDGEGLDTRSDVFSLGVLLFELASGQRYRPWAEQTQVPLHEARERIAQEQARGPGATGAVDLRRGRLAELDAIARRALAPEREQRYGGADALADELDRWLAQLPVEAVGHRAGYRLRCFMRRHALLSASVIVSALLILGLLWRLALQLEETRRERDSAEQVTAVLIDTFRAADPYAHPGGSISARELLQSAARRVRGDALSPPVRLRLLDTLGDVQFRLQLYDDAEATWGEAEALADDENARLRLRLQRARAAMDGERFEAAETASREIATQAADAGLRPLQAEALILLAEVLDYLDRRDEAVATLGQAEALIVAADAPEQHQAWLRQRGRIALGAGEDDAADWLARATDAAERLWGGEDLRSLDALSDLAIAQGRRGELAASEANRRRVADLTERLWGGDSPGLAIALDNLAVLLQRRGGDERLREAEALSRRALAINRASLGEASMHTGLTANTLASVLLEQGQADEAVVLQREALDAIQRSLGASHAYAGILQHNLARALIATNALDEAESRLGAALAVLDPRLPATDPRRLAMALTRIELDIARGKGESARAALDDLDARLPDTGAEPGPERRRLLALQRRLPPPTPSD